MFRVLPRKDAAAVFEYLSHDAQEALLKAMAQEDVAALLNNMAPDDRTMFLEELPADVTRAAARAADAGGARRRADAARLSGRLDRPADDAALRRGARGLDRPARCSTTSATHGQDSETLNVIYVVDEQGLLIDDIRIREFLLAPLDSRVADLMDRRFVALKATDDQETAVAVFRAVRPHARCRSPTRAGMLIGIVTIDDVLDVAEATATQEIQRIGGSEALDEPYMEIALRPHDSEARRLADGAVPRRDADRDGDGRVRGGDRAGGGAGAVRAADHLERRQLRLAGLDAGDPRAGARRGRRCATGGG